MNFNIQWSLIPRGLRCSISETKSSEDITKCNIWGVSLLRCLLGLTMCGKNKFSLNHETNASSLLLRLAHLALAPKLGAGIQAMLLKLKSPTISVGALQFCPM